LRLNSFLYAQLRNLPYIDQCLPEWISFADSTFTCLKWSFLSKSIYPRISSSSWRNRCSRPESNLELMKLMKLIKLMKLMRLMRLMKLMRLMRLTKLMKLMKLTKLMKLMKLMKFVKKTWCEFIYFFFQHKTMHIK
jgi:hypothetical protein